MFQIGACKAQTCEHRGRSARLTSALRATPGNQALLRKSAASAAPATIPPIVDTVLREPGRPLDAATRIFMEPRFGYDFSAVRVHTGEQAAQSARAVDALAYTVGRDVVFAAGRYA